MSVKISELPILDSLADNDILAGVDTSANTTSKIELGTLKNYIDTNTQYTAGTNIDITNNVISAPDVPTKEEFDSLSTIFNAFPTESDEDESMTLDGTAEVKFKKFDLKGNTSQTGTPTPSSPIPVNVVSGDNEINICGKNLFDKSTAVLNKMVTGTGGLIDFTGVFSSDYIKVQPSTDYYVNQYMPTVVAFDKDKNAIGYIRNASGEATFTTPNNCEYIRARMFDASIDMTTALNNAMLNLGTSATTYEPYQGNTYNIDLPSGIELCKIGTYQDYIYKDSDKWYLHKEIGKVVLNGSENWGKSSKTQVNRYFVANVFVTILNANSIDLISKYFVCITPNQSDSNNIGLAKYNENGLMVNFSLTDTDFDTLAEFKTWLSSHNVEVNYVLSTPTNTEITYEPLIDQLNAIEQAQSKENQTNISQVNNDKPFILDVTAIKSLQNVLDRIELLES